MRIVFWYPALALAMAVAYYPCGSTCDIRSVVRQSTSTTLITLHDMFINEHVSKILMTLVVP